MTISLQGVISRTPDTFCPDAIGRAPARSAEPVADSDAVVPPARAPKLVTAMAASHTPSSPRKPPTTAGTASKQLDEDTKRLLAAILDFTSLQRQRETNERPSQLQIGQRMPKHALAARHTSALLTVALYGPMTVTQLADRQRITLKAASLTAVELEQAGMLARREDPADRRRTILTIPKAKEHVISQGLLTRASHLQRTLDRLTPSERRGLLKGLEALTEEMARDPN